MIPIRDENPSSTRPVVTMALIVANVVAFLLELLALGPVGPGLIQSFGVVPARLLSDPVGESWTVFTSMFMHGGWEHLGGNMLFLYIFGDNVEDALGHKRFLGFYLLSGLAAAAAQVFVSPDSMVPMVGASGAIAGVLGAYLVLYPRAPIHVLNPIPPLWLLLGFFFVLPAWIVVGEWFVWNMLHGVGSLASPGMGGVAFFAHIGGFVVGLLAIKPMLLGRGQRTRATWKRFRPPPRVRPPRGDTGTFRDPWFPG
ncbi:MAG: rhomboid family intramembrane serine protease [Polyangiaceae bacterium]